MSRANSPESPKTRRACPERCRRDGWTAERQLRFLDALTRTRSVTRAAAFAGMSRESAYRFRNRSDSLFALLWDRALESHKRASVEKSKAPKILGNPSKVTKWRKWKDPFFQSLIDELRDLPLNPPAAATAPSPGQSC
jgi:hypothetical protein